MGYGWYSWRPYVPVAVRRSNAAQEIARLRKRGAPIAPVVIQGRMIARSFWGKAWCDNLEAYGDYANRLPRGRTYVRNGSVMDLQLGAGTVTALVSGSDLYRVSVTVKPLRRARWQAIVRECAGRIDSLVELLQGRLSRAVMEVLIRPRTGLFPEPREISFECSCPDWAGVCKHVAATFYGVGARLDAEPELFFRLRRVDQTDLLTAAGDGAALAERSGGRSTRIAESALGEIFGIEIDEATATPAPTKKGRLSRSPGKTRVRPTAPPEPAPPPPGRRQGDTTSGRAKLAHRRQAGRRAAGNRTTRRHRPPQPPPRG